MAEGLALLHLNKLSKVGEGSLYSVVDITKVCALHGLLEKLAGMHCMDSQARVAVDSRFIVIALRVDRGGGNWDAVVRPWGVKMPLRGSGGRRG